jgi:membrane-bound lytic murein transglycosylase D
MNIKLIFHSFYTFPALNRPNLFSLTGILMGIFILLTGCSQLTTNPGHQKAYQNRKSYSPYIGDLETPSNLRNKHSPHHPSNSTLNNNSDEEAELDGEQNFSLTEEWEEHGVNEKIFKEYALLDKEIDLNKILIQRIKIPEFFGENFELTPELLRMTNFWIHYFTQRNLDRFVRHLNNAGLYKKTVETILTQYDLPLELFYVGIIESGFNLKIKSRASAVGPWQFIAGTGKRYGLKIDTHVDERVNLFKSTHSAAKYFRALHNIFNDWPLALAAYNAGEYKILRSLKKANGQTFGDLCHKSILPKETRYYVPKIIAVKTILENHPEFQRSVFYQSHQSNANKLNDGENKSEFLLGSEDLNQAVYYNVEISTRLSKISTASNIPLPLLLELNPDIKGDFIPASKSKPHKIFIPLAEMEKMDAIDSSTWASITVTPPKVVEYFSYSGGKKQKRTKLSWAKNYRVRKGDTISQISKKLGVKKQVLVNLNPELNKNSPLRAGKDLYVPQRPVTVYNVRKGDSLQKIASKYKISVSDLILLNSLASKRVVPKQKIYVPI